VKEKNPPHQNTTQPTASQDLNPAVLDPGTHGVPGKKEGRNPSDRRSVSSKSISIRSASKHRGSKTAPLEGEL